VEEYQVKRWDNLVRFTDNSSATHISGPDKPKQLPAAMWHCIL